MAIYVDGHNSVYVMDRTTRRLQKWTEAESHPREILVLHDSGDTHSLFVTISGDVYVDNGAKGRVEKWAPDSTTSVTAMHVSSPCFGLFVDIKNDLYCSMHDAHQVVHMSLDSSATMTPTIAAGNGIAGSESTMLDHPHGIIVDVNRNLYIADYGNHRIQLVKAEQLDGTTVAGYGAPNTIRLQHPTDVLLDADGYLFIVDSGNHRIVRSDPSGFRCLIGCSGKPSSARNGLDRPHAGAFDIYGNLLITDRNNHRVQKFHLVANACGKLIRSDV